MKAVSPLCLEPRALLWLLEVEEAEGSCPEQPCVYSLAPLRLAGLLRCTVPYPSASQAASHSVDEFWSGRCDVVCLGQLVVAKVAG